MFFINKIWNPGIFKNLCGYASIFLKISCDNRNLSVTMILFSDQPQDPSGSFLHFFLRISRRKDLYLLLLPLIDSPVVTEQMLFQKIKCRGIRKPGLSTRHDPDRLFDILRKFRKRADHLMAHIKKLVRFSHRKKLFSDIHRHRHGNSLTDSQKFPQDFKLYWCKSCVSIQKKDTSLKFLRKLDLFCQNLKNFLRCHKMSGKIFTERLIQNFHILEFHLEKRLILALTDHLIQFLFFDLVLHELRNKRLYLIQIAWFLHLISEIDQILLVHLYQFLEHHVFACFFHDPSRITANFLKNAVRKTLKT